MTGAELMALEGDLERYLASYDEVFGRAESREHLRRFARGQLSEGPALVCIQPQISWHP